MDTCLTQHCSAILQSFSWQRTARSHQTVYTDRPRRTLLQSAVYTALTDLQTDTVTHTRSHTPGLPEDERHTSPGLPEDDRHTSPGLPEDERHTSAYIDH